MSCPTLISPLCVITDSLVGTAASGVTDGMLGQLAKSIQDGIAWVVGNTTSWWVKVSSPDLAVEPAIARLQRWTMPFAAAVSVLGLIVAGGKMALTRKPHPLIDIGSGLVAIAAASSIGVLMASLLVKMGDAWSSWVLDASTGGQFGQRLTSALQLTGASPGLVIVLGVIAILLGAIQAVLMLFREASLVVLAGVLPLAASGALIRITRPWFRKVTGWMLALIFYKPAAAALYATTFTMIGETKDARTFLMAFAMLALSLIALPVLMKFFTWTTGSIESSGNREGILGAAVMGAVAVGAFRGGGAHSSSRSSDAGSHASYLAGQLDGNGRPNRGPATPPGSTGNTSTSGAGGSAAASKGGTAAAGAATAGVVTVVSGLATGARNAADASAAATQSPHRER
ncbi:hypothetical protein [Nonomuraea sp. NPDC046570]|uniref:hypothetical protein n=1 Tax=Nonomuraea sp. NPDC046570 TaxID=3155255 RepID=UPI0033FE8CE3